MTAARSFAFQSPRGDFGFLKLCNQAFVGEAERGLCFNPLAGILVF